MYEIYRHEKRVSWFLGLPHYDANENVIFCVFFFDGVPAVPVTILMSGNLYIISNQIVLQTKTKKSQQALSSSILADLVQYLFYILS